MNSPWILVGIGGAFGAIGRYAVSLGMADIHAATGFPWATMLVNILGCFLIGVLFHYVSENPIAWITPLLIIGFLGGFTTFSSFGLDALKLFQSKQHLFLVMYVLGSNILGIAAVFIGVKGGQLLFQTSVN